MTEQREKRQQSWLEARMAPSTWDEQTREVDIVWTTGADVQRRDWATGSVYLERLAVEGADLTRMNAGAPLLDSHDSWSTRSVIGVVVEGSARVEDGRGVARVRLSAAESAVDAVTKITEGTLRNISVGYAVREWKIDKGGKGQPEVRTATAWEPMEVSIVPIPADAGAQVRAADTAAQEDQMTEPTPAPVDLDAVRKEAAQSAINAERKRQADIRAAAQPHGLDAQRYIDEGVSVDAARAAMLAELAERSKEQDVQGQHKGATVTRSHAEQVVEGIQNALEARALPGKVALTDAGRAHAHLSLGRMAEEMLRQNGVDVSRMTEREIAKAAMQVGGVRSFSSSHTTGDFPYLLANVANKYLLEGYGAEPMTHRAFSRTRTVRDLKQVSAVRMGSVDAIPKVVEGAEYTYATIGEEREVYTVAKYGQILPFTLEMVINDDLDGFRILTEEMGRAAARRELELVYGSAGVFGSNSGSGETMGDGNPLFDAAHSNLAAHAAFSDAGVAALRKLLRLQTDLNGNRVNFMGKYLLVPAALEHAADQLVNGTFVPTAATSATTQAIRGLEVIVEPRLDDISAAAYYLISDRPFLEIGRLAGYAGPQIETIEQKDADQIGYKVRDFLAAKAIDWRPVAYDPGS